MTRNDLAPPNVDSALIERLADAFESLAKLVSPAASDLQCFTPAQAAELLGKTENWVVEAIQDGRVPCTYIGKSPRLTAAHIRWVQSSGERMPSKYSIRAA